MVFKMSSKIRLLLIVFLLFSLVSAEWFSRDGDMVIGVVLPAHDMDDNVKLTANNNGFSYYATGTTCTGRLVYKRALLVTQFRRIIDEINADPTILGGLKLGYEIVDSCSLSYVANAQAARWIASKVEMDARNYSVSLASGGPISSRPIPFVLGAYTSGVTAQLTSLLSQVDIPVIDFGSTSPLLSDRTNYPLFARTSPSDHYQATAIASLMMNYLGWNCTHLIYSEGLYGETGAAALREELTNYGICRATDVKAPVATKGNPAALKNMTDIVTSMASKFPTTAAIICFCEEGTLENLLIALRDFYSSQLSVGRGGRGIRFLIIASDTWGTSLPLDDVQSAANAAITLQPGNRDFPGFTDWVSQNFQTLIDPSNIDPWMSEFAQDFFSMSHAEIIQKRSQLALPPNNVPEDDYIGLMTTAVHLGVQALRLQLEASCPPGTGNLTTRCGTSYIRHAFNGRALYNYLPSATKYLSRPFAFMDNLDGQAIYDFYSYRYSTNSYTNFGFWDLSVKGLAINGREAEAVRYWPDTSQLITAICPPTPNDASSVIIGTYWKNTCPSIFYYPNPDLVNSTTNLSIACTYFCRENRVFNVCDWQASTVLATTTLPFHWTTMSADTKSSAITGLAVVLAVIACCFLVCLGFLIYAICKCRNYRNKLKQQEDMIKVASPSDINSLKAGNAYWNNRNGAYAAMFSGSTTSSLTYVRKNQLGGIEVIDVQPSLLPTSLHDELYLVPQSKTTSQISQSARIKRIVSGLGGNDDFAQMVERFYVPNSELIFGEAFADGKFAFVYHAVLKKPMPEDGTPEATNTKALPDLPVAVKVLKSREAEDLHDFLKEAFLMQTFKHPNVMQLLGISLLFDQPHIVVPLMSNGNLRDFVRQYFSSLGEDRLLNFCRQIAIGMEYLSHNKFIHRDLAARNVLVDSEGLLKIADFGMSRHLQQSDYYKPVTIDRPLPIRWHPPESLQMRVFEEKSDVWSFGVVMWEIYSGGMQPYGGLSNNEVVEHIAAGNRLLRPDRCPEQVYNEVMMKCWQVAVKDRPSFAQLIQLIGAIPPSESRNNPTNSSFLQESNPVSPMSEDATYVKGSSV